MGISNKILSYCQRFTVDNYKTIKLDKFYTQLSISQYATCLPYLSDVEKFCQRLALAIARQEKICIYTDYDTDAVTATATMYWGLREFGILEENLDFYAPDRFTEGYGMNVEAIEFLAKYYDLIVSVDCGINSVQEAEKVKEINQNLRKQDQKDNNQKDNKKNLLDSLVLEKLGSRKNNHCDLIITDHHHLHGQKPDCFAVCNPRLSNDLEFWQFNLEFNFSVQQKIFSKNSINQSQTSFFNKIQTRKVLTKNFLSSSVTGVGVAWFCLVWLGYYLQELEQVVFL